MDIVGVAIIRRAYRENGFQRRRAAHGNLQAIKPAPAFTHHTNGAGAPILFGNPRDDFNRIILLLQKIFIFHQAIGFT